jgi:ribonuclease BN (tRNA processing enzyme)
MKVQVLGCSGGIGGRDLRTTSLLVDDDILIDCGTGVGDLSLDQLVRIDHLFLTHAHLDHIACLPLLIDTVCDLRDKPLVVHATAATIAVLRDHIFNWAVWPDFSVIPSVEAAFMTLPRSMSARR